MIYTILYLRVYYVKHIMLLTFTTAEKVKTILIFYQIYYIQVQQASDIEYFLQIEYF